MGYKLAGFTVLGGVEIDKKMMEVYRVNHNPKYSYLMGVKEFNQLHDTSLSKELFNLDILDGSPPCSSFSMNGKREKGWGKKKKFREGQAEQVLDDLFFDFINIANRLRPKIVVSENVKGLIIGKAKGYVKEIFQNFSDAGYDSQLFLLNSAFMGVPQARERTFFISVRKDLNKPKIKLNFKEEPIILSKAFEDIDYTKELKKPLTAGSLALWKQCKAGLSFETVKGKGKGFSQVKLSPNKPSCTLTAGGSIFHWGEPRYLTRTECIRVQSFPDDYNFLENKPAYITGMSVPPFMMQRIALQIFDQLIKEN